MTRILLGAEGGSEEVIGIRLIQWLCQEASVDCKEYPDRGFSVVRRSAPTLAKAAYFSFYDLLVIQFDLDDSLAPEEDGGIVVSNSARWRDIMDRTQSSLNSLPIIGRERAVRVALMAGCQSTDAWMMWGVNNGKGCSWEAKSRKELKLKLYGDPPRGIVDKASLLVDVLIKRMESTPITGWPCSLVAFITQLEESIRGGGGVCLHPTPMSRST